MVLSLWYADSARARAVPLSLELDPNRSAEVPQGTIFVRWEWVLDFGKIPRSSIACGEGVAVPVRCSSKI